MFHHLFLYPQTVANMRVRSFCGSYEMPLAEATGEVTSDTPVREDDVRECQACNAVAEREREVFGSGPPKESLADEMLWSALVIEARKDGYAYPNKVYCLAFAGRVATVAGGKFSVADAVSSDPKRPQA